MDKMIYNFRWIIENKLAGSSRPVMDEDLQWLKEQGIKAIVCLTELPMYQNDAAKMGLEYLHIPVEDYDRPSLEQIDQFVEYVDKMISMNKPVDAYCEAGLGRTGCMLAAYLVSKGFSPDGAINEVRKANKQSIHTDAQIEAIYEFATVKHSVP